jgi:O-antigen/teichoic acid export membrane protein
MSIELPIVDESAGSTRKITRNASIYLAAQILSWVVTFVSLTVFSRTIGKSGTGILAFLGNAFAPIAILTLGIDSYLVKELGRDRSLAGPLMRATFGIRLVSLPIILLLSIIVLWWLKLTPSIWAVAVAMIAMNQVCIFSEPIRSMLVALEQPRRVAIFDISTGVGSILAIPFLRYGPIAIVIAMLSTHVVMLVVRWWWVRDMVRLVPSFDLTVWRGLILGGIPFIINVWIMQWYGFTGVWMLNHFVNKEAVGVFSNAQKLIGTFMFVSAAISSALLPSMARMADRSPEELRNLETRIIETLIVLGLPFAALLFLLAKPVSLLIFGPTFFEMPLTLQAYSFALVPIYVVSTIYMFVIARGRNAVWTIYLVITVGIFAAAAWVLVPYMRDHFHNGAAGAAAATAIAEAIAAILGIKLVGINLLNREFTVRLLRCGIATLGMAAVIWLTQRLFVVVPLALGLFAFTLIAVKLRVLPQREQDLIVAWVKGKLGRFRPAGGGTADPPAP